MKNLRWIGMGLAVIAFLGAVYYVKSDVFHIDLIDNRHVLFFKKMFDTPRDRAEKQKLFQELLRKSQAGEPVGWVGQSRRGQQLFRDGLLSTVGSVHTVLVLPQGEAVIGIQARGTFAKGHYPYMVVDLDDKEIGSLYVRGPGWIEYPFKVHTGGGRKILSVTFTNDVTNPKTGVDRNLQVGEVSVA